MSGARTGPDVSVITPAWNAAGRIGHAIASLQAQDDIAWEMILVDDASADGTMAIAEAAARSDPRIRPVRQAVNAGPSAARNRALGLARAPFVAVLDDDDTMPPGRLRRLVDLAVASGADVVADNMARVADAPGGPLLGSFFARLDGDDPLGVSLADYLDPRTAARWGGDPGYLKPVFRKARLDACGARYDETLRNSEDFYLVAGLLAQGARMLVDPRPGYAYTIREGSLSYRLSAEKAQAILAAKEAFRARHAASFDPETEAASRRRLQQCRNACAFAQLVEAIKAGRPDRMAGVVAGRPTAVPHMARELARIAREKLAV